MNKKNRVWIKYPTKQHYGAHDHYDDDDDILTRKTDKYYPNHFIEWMKLRSKNKFVNKMILLMTWILS